MRGALKKLPRREDRAEVAEKASGREPPMPESKPVWLFLERLIFYGLLFITALSAIPYGTVEPWWIAVFECVVLALGAVWFLTGIFKSDWRFLSNRLLWPIIALLFFIILQTIDFGGSREATSLKGALTGAISADPYGTRLLVVKALALMLAFVMLRGYATSHRRLRALIYVVVGIAVVSALFGILRQTTHHNSPGFFLPHLMPNSGYGQFINRNHFAFLMEMAFGLLLGLLISGVTRERVLLYLSFLVPVWFALILSNSRGGIFSMLCQLFFAALMFTFLRVPQTNSAGAGESGGWLLRIKRSPVIRVLLIACLLAGVSIGVVWIGGDQLASRIEMGQSASVEKTEARQGESRSEVWRATWALVRDNPLVGVGFGGYWAVIPKYHDASGELTPQEAHNDYLEILASGGLIGAALCAWLVVALLAEARRQLRSTDNFRRAVSFGALVGLFGVAVHSLFDFGLHITVNSLVFIMLTVLATAEVRDHVRKKRGKEAA